MMRIAQIAGLVDVSVEFEPAWSVGTASVGNASVGSAMFGGAIAAGCVRAATTVLKRDDLVPMTSSMRYVAPTPPGPATISVLVIRSGRSYATAFCEVRVGARMTASALLTLAPRASVGVVTAPWAEDLTGVPPWPHRESAASAVADRVDWRSAVDWRAGALPGTEFTSWFRLRQTDAPAFDPARYLLAADLIGPALAADGVLLPFRIATVSLDVTTISLTDSPWLKQRIRVHRTEREGVAELHLVAQDGTVVATAIQRAVILPATDEEMPFAVTGFGWGRP